MDDMKPPPHDKQAEMGVLGSCLLNADALGAAREIVSEGDFYILAHQDIFAAICAVADEKGDVDIVLLRRELGQRDKLKSVGGEHYLAELMRLVPTSANVEHYASIVRQDATRRALLALRTAIEGVGEPGADVTDALRRLQDGMDSIQPVGAAVDHVAGHMAEADRLMDAWARGEHPETQTGLASLDEKIDGFLAGTLAIVASEPRDGKTALACNIAVNVARKGKGVLFFSAEMAGEILTMNMLSIISGVEWRQIRRGALSPGDKAAWDEAKATLAKLPLHIDDAPNVWIDRLYRTALSHCRRHDVGLIIADYVQIIRCHVQESRNIQVATVGSELKRLARECHVPLLALSQVTRDEGGRSHLRWAKELEQDADYIMFLARKAQYQWGSKEAEPDVAERRLKIEKNKFGPGGVLRLTFEKPCLRFYDEHCDRTGSSQRTERNAPGLFCACP